MNKVEKVSAYKISNGNLFFNKHVAEAHQKELNLEEFVKNVTPNKACRIFNIAKTETRDHEAVKKLCDNFDRYFDDFEGFVNWFTRSYLKTPELLEFIQLIEKELKGA